MDNNYPFSKEISTVEEKSHQELDRAVDKCYTKRTFKSDKERIEFLFELYEVYVGE